MSILQFTEISLKNQRLMDQMQAIYEKSFGEDTGFPWECLLYKLKMDQIKAKIQKRKNEKHHIIGAFQEEKLVAFLILKFFGDFSYASFMAVDPSYRNREIGTQVGQKAIATAAADADEVHLQESALFFEVEKPENAPTEALKMASEKLIRFYLLKEKGHVVFLDIEYIEPTLIKDGRDMYLAMVPFPDREYIESNRLLRYIETIYRLEFNLIPQKHALKFQRYMKVITDSIGNREKISGIPKIHRMR